MNLLDVARGAYVNSPAWLRRSVAPLIGMLPVGLRYGRQYRQWRRWIERSRSDRDFVATFRERRLREILERCRQHSPYYRDLFSDLGAQAVGDGLDEAFYRRLPVLDKQQVREFGRRLLTVDPATVDDVSTSGSSGQPLKFFLDRDRGVREWAFINHFWSACGFREGDVRAVLRGLYLPDADHTPWEWDAALAELRLSPFHMLPQTMDRYLRLIDEYGARYIHGYPSAIAILANHVMRSGWRPRRAIQGLFPISENTLPHQRELFAQAFPEAALVTYYGMSEKVAIAGELAGQPDVYEFEPLYGLAELVDDDGAPITRPGEEGRIVATSFICTAMPLLRYDTGDRAVLIEPGTFENCHRMRVRSIRSRWEQEFLIGANGEPISITAINIHSPVYAHIRAFQFFQERPGEAVVKIDPADEYGLADLQPFIDEISAKVGGSVSFRIELTDRFRENERGKRPFIDQRLPQTS